jgi:hypothetical protein
MHPAGAIEVIEIFFENQILSERQISRNIVELKRPTISASSFLLLQFL